MEYHDRVLKCAECGAEFVFTAGEQMFFADKGFKNEPKRCKGCKAKRAEGGGGGGGGGSQMRSETKTTCSQCGKDTTVPRRDVQFFAASVFSNDARSARPDASRS
jgi:DNA-directed RNA polymerase subunit RPC12/RpoP